MMNTTIAKIISSALLCVATVSFAHAKDTASQNEVKKQIQICSKKKQGDWVVYANKGVIFNGTCEPNENGKLQFREDIYELDKELYLKFLKFVIL